MFHDFVLLIQKSFQSFNYQYNYGAIVKQNLPAMK